MARRCAWVGETRRRVEGRGGTGLPETMSASAMVTGSPPRSGRTTHASLVQATQVPSRSVRAGPPLGPVSPRTTRRTTTRVPTTCGPSMWAGTTGY